MARASKQVDPETGRGEMSDAAVQAAIEAAGLESNKDGEFLPSDKTARYAGDFIPQETQGPQLLEDDQLETEWFNPTKHDVVLPIYIGTFPQQKAWVAAYLKASPARRQEMKTGLRIFIVKAGASRRIPSEYDLAVQRTHCMLPSCTAKKDDCKDPDHPRTVVAGLGPQLICKRWHKVPSLSSNLDAARAAHEEAQRALAVASQQRIEAEIHTSNARKLLEESQATAASERAARERAERELADLKAKLK